MKTLLIKINPNNPEENKIQKAAKIIKNGGLVAFPTETVYGLGANVFNTNALKKIFKAKCRPFDDPLIVHIADKNDIFKLAKRIPNKTLKLINKFWPGPLTIIVEKSKLVPKIVTAGLKTVAIRMPNNKIALEIIKQSGVPIAAPSANSFSKPSPTSARHVFNDLKNKIPLIIDGGETQIGLESTIVSLSKRHPIILRPGKITSQEIAKIFGKIEIFSGATNKALAPGMKYKHYAPNAHVVLVKSKNTNIQRLIDKEKLYGKKNRGFRSKKISSRPGLHSKKCQRLR